jgi:hypothetical protein
MKKTDVLQNVISHLHSGSIILPYRRTFLFSHKSGTDIKDIAHHTARALWRQASPLIGAAIEFLQQKEKTE